MTQVALRVNIPPFSTETSTVAPFEAGRVNVEDMIILMLYGGFAWSIFVGEKSKRWEYADFYTNKLSNLEYRYAVLSTWGPLC